ncbi:MAG: hypothetical protein K2X39_09850 [Silvanigrellaceae bacterium]|nr:hypothetical protein [Silvanigrellaceae bacterium]
MVRASKNKVKTTHEKVPRENIFVSLLFNVLIPIFILSKLSGVEALGPLRALFVALAFPFVYAVYDFYRRKQTNVISILGIVSISVKGVFALYKLDGFWFALQEAAIPTLLGLATVLSCWLGKPLVNYFIYNDFIFNISLLDEKIKQLKAQKAFKKLIWQFTLILGASFLLGGISNYFLAIHIIVSPAGTEAFNHEFSKMTAISHFVILIPKLFITMGGLWWFIYKLKKITGLSTTEMLKTQ